MTQSPIRKVTDFHRRFSFIVSLPVETNQDTLIQLLWGKMRVAWPESETLLNSSYIEHEYPHQLEQSKFTTKFWIVLTLVIVILPVGLAINLRVLATVTLLPRRKRNRPANILIGHFSTVAIIFEFFSVLLVSEQASLITLTGHGLCEFMTYLKCVFTVVFSLNSTAIVYERFRTFSHNAQGTLLVFRIVCLMWLVATVSSIPTIFMTTYVEYMGKENPLAIENDIAKEKTGICKSILLFGSLPATVIYELGKLLFFHLSVVLYMGKAIYKLKLTRRYIYLLKPVPNSKLIKKVRNIRFICVHFITFILIWLPCGVLVCFHRLKKRQDTKPAIRKSDPFLGIVLGLFFTAYFVFTPLIYLCLMEEFGWCTRKPISTTEESKVNKVKRVKKQTQGEQNELSSGEIGSHQEEVMEMVCLDNKLTINSGPSEDLSRASTYHPTSTTK